MSAADLFNCVRIRYAEIIGEMNNRQVRPPDQEVFNAMAGVDALVRPGYRRHTTSEIAAFEANLQTLHLFIGPSPIADIWSVFRAQCQSYIGVARTLV